VPSPVGSLISLPIPAAGGLCDPVAHSCSIPSGSESDSLSTCQRKGLTRSLVWKRWDSESHARAILSADFPEAIAELCGVLSEVAIPIEEIVAGGGAEAKGTQRLRRALTNLKWVKTEFVIEKKINGKQRESISGRRV
jgi:hypothetical protein